MKIILVKQSLKCKPLAINVEREIFKGSNFWKIELFGFKFLKIFDITPLINEH